MLDTVISRLLEGRDKELVCQAAGIPPPLVTWTFNNRTLDSQEGRLELRDVGRSQEGNYLCSATNKYGQVSTEVSVQVIRGLRKENENLVPDVVKNIKETISLPCDFKVDERVEEETEFIWLKEDTKLDTENSKYSLLPNKSLLIQNITLEDPGLYTCNVVTPLQSVKSSIQLMVSGESPEIINDFEKITIHEGETLELSCRARGSPQPRLEWRVRDRPVLSSHLVDVTMADTEYSEKTVRIRGARRGNEGLYQCIATNNVGSVMKNSNVIVIKRTRVSIVSHDGPQEISIQAGQKLQLPCRVENDERNRITDIRWTKGDKTIEVGIEDRIDFGYDGSLIIFNVQKRHEGRYRCRVKTQGDEESAEVPLKVIVNAPVITSHSPHQRVFSGSSLDLQCDANGIPAPEISWTFNKTSTLVKGELYGIRNAISTDSGHYTCIAKNSIGETRQTMEVWVVTVPRLEELYKIKAGSELVVPCVRPGPSVSSQWRRGNQSVIESDSQGNLVIDSLTEDMVGDYSCEIKISGGESKIINTEIAIMPDIVLTQSKTLTINEGSNFTLKCDVLPGVNAKRMWKKDGKLVFPSSDAVVDIQEYGRSLVVSEARLEDTGSWTCVATVGQLGRDSIDYQVTVRQSKLACSDLSPPTIKAITPVNNSTVRLAWQVNNFNASCYETFKIFWWTNETNSEYHRKNAALADREKIIEDLKPHTAYFFQVNLVRDSRHNAIQHGNTKSHWMQYFHHQELPTSSSSKAVIIIVVIVIVLLGLVLTLLYYKRSLLTDFMLERRKARSGLEFSEYPTKLTANPDFMASLAPTWPEPEPDPTEDQAFIQQQRQLSRRRGSKTSITSSWSSLFNVVSTEDITSEQHYKDSATYKGRTRKE